MSLLDRFRKKPQELPRSEREKKITEIATRVHDEESVPYLKDGEHLYSERDLISDDALHDAAEGRAEYGEDLEYPKERVPTVDEVLGKKVVDRLVRAGKRRAKQEEKERLLDLQAQYPNSDLDWSREFAQVCGVPGVRWTQEGRYFDTAGREVEDPKI